MKCDWCGIEKVFHQEQDITAKTKKCIMCRTGKIQVPKLNKKTRKWEHLTEGVIGYYCLTTTKEYEQDKEAIPLNIIIERHKRHPTALKRAKEISKLLNRKIYPIPAWGYKKYVINLNKKLTPAEITKKLLTEIETQPHTSE